MSDQDDENLEPKTAMKQLSAAELMEQNQIKEQARAKESQEEKQSAKGKVMRQLSSTGVVRMANDDAPKSTTTVGKDAKDHSGVMKKLSLESDEEKKEQGSVPDKAAPTESVNALPSLTGSKKDQIEVKKTDLLGGDFLSKKGNSKGGLDETDAKTDAKSDDDKSSLTIGIKAIKPIPDESSDKITSDDSKEIGIKKPELASSESENEISLMKPESGDSPGKLLQDTDEPLVLPKPDKDKPKEKLTLKKESSSTKPEAPPPIPETQKGTDKKIKEPPKEGASKETEVSDPIDPVPKKSKIGLILAVIGIFLVITVTIGSILAWRFYDQKAIDETDLFSTIDNDDRQLLDKVLSRSPERITDLNEIDEPLLIYAVLSRKPQMLEAILAHSPDIEAKSSNGNTALHLAVSAADREMANLLIEEEADTNARNASGKTPLHIAIHERDTAFTKLLIKSGADVNARTNTGWTPLHTAIRKGEIGIAKALINNSSTKLEEPGSNGLTALHLVAGRNTPLLPLLLNRKVNLEALTASGERPVGLAVKAGNMKNLRLLVDEGANINYRNKAGQTPLHFACKASELEIIKYLLRKDALVNVRDFYNETPLDVCRKRKIRQLIKEFNGKSGLDLK